LTKAESDASTAARNESVYLTSHPNATVVNDPQYALLDTRRLQAQSTVQDLQTRIDTLNQDLAALDAGSDVFFNTLDPPVLPAATSRVKLLLTTGGVGSVIGLLACVLYVLITVRRDKAFYTASSMKNVTAYGILMEVPQFSKKTMELVTPGFQQ
jgi:hypothetical protein